MPNQVVTTTGNAIKSIADELNLDTAVVESVINALTSRIREAIRAEMPFALRGLGKFYLRYKTLKRLMSRSRNSAYYSDKVMREVRFAASDEWKSETNGWVHDFGIKSNHPRELLKLRIKPDELDKMRKKKILDDQRSLGFRSDLLFDEVPLAEKAFESTLGQPPSADEIMRRIGINLED